MLGHSQTKERATGNPNLSLHHRATSRLYRSGNLVMSNNEMVNIALRNATVSTCTAGDANGDDEITVNEIVACVNNALNGCQTVAGGGMAGAV